MSFTLGITLDSCKVMVQQLNHQFQSILMTNPDPNFQVVNAFKILVDQKPYKILTVSSMDIKVAFFGNII